MRAPPARFASQTVDSEIETELDADPRIERAEPIEGLDKRFDENPYAPLGLRVGTFIVLRQASRAASPGRRTPIPAPTANPPCCRNRRCGSTPFPTGRATRRRSMPSSISARRSRARRSTRRAAASRARSSASSARLDGAWIDRLRDRSGIGVLSRRHRGHARPADQADLRRQSRRREGCRQVAAQADRQCRARGVRRRRAFDRRHGFAGRPQFDAGRGACCAPATRFHRR